MNEDYEVMTRKLCMERNCHSGYTDEKFKVKCTECKDGWVIEWVDLRTLLRQMINI